MSDRDLPQWAVDMTDEEWAKQGSGKYGTGYNNCAECGHRLIITLCKYGEAKFYCVEHCPEHKWQADYDWPRECARCGVHWDNYLASLLEEHGIEY